MFEVTDFYNLLYRFRYRTIYFVVHNINTGAPVAQNFFSDIRLEYARTFQIIIHNLQATTFTKVIYIYIYIYIFFPSPPIY